MAHNPQLSIYVERSFCLSRVGIVDPGVQNTNLETMGRQVRARWELVTRYGDLGLCIIGVGLEHVSWVGERKEPGKGITSVNIVILLLM